MYKFRVFYWCKEKQLEDLLDGALAEAEKAGYVYHDLRFAQSSASGTGMSAVLVLRDKHEALR